MRDKCFHVRCSADEHQLLLELAKDMGFSISQLVRWLVKQESERRGQNER
jgi:hypothetical protein